MSDFITAAEVRIVEGEPELLESEKRSYLELVFNLLAAFVLIRYLASRLSGCRGGTFRLVLSFSAVHPDRTIVAKVAFIFTLFGFIWA